MSEDNEFLTTHDHVHVEWKIKKFYHLPKKENFSLESPPFHFSNSQWSLLVYPNEPEDWIGVLLRKIKFAKERGLACIIGMKKDDGSVLGARNFNLIIEMITYRFGFRQFLKRSSLGNFRDSLAPDGSLTVFFTARILNTKDEQSQTTSPYGIPTLTEDLKRLYLDRQYSDITIKIQNEELVAHKCILAARSKVFAAMFQHDMAEKSSGIVEVDDSTPESFNDFILYLYTGKLEVVSSSNAFSLYQAADKYDVVELKEECARIMERELSVESICDVIRIATTHGESDLLTAATDFFTKNLVTILKSPKWQVFIAENPTISNELILKAVDKPEN